MAFNLQSAAKVLPVQEETTFIKTEFKKRRKKKEEGYTGPDTSNVLTDKDRAEMKLNEPEREKSGKEHSRRLWKHFRFCAIPKRL